MLTLIKPACEDLWFRRRMLEDEETMSYNHAWGGTIPFPTEQWRDWYYLWVVNPGDRRYYRYLKNEEGRFVGEVAYHRDDTLRGYIADVIILASCRDRGYGSEGLDLLCAAAKANGADVLYDDIAIDNPAAGLFLRHGLSEIFRTEDKIILKKIL